MSEHEGTWTTASAIELKLTLLRTRPAVFWVRSPELRGSLAGGSDETGSSSDGRPSSDGRNS